MTDKHNRPWRLKFHLQKHEDQSKAQHPVVLTHRNNSVSAPAPVKPKFTGKLDFTKNIPTDAEIPYPPFINVEGVPNFRDVGGYACTSPGKHSIRQGYAYRCSELSQITETGDKTLIGTLKITILYDLRSEIEAADPHGQPSGVKCISTPVFRQKDISSTIGIQQLEWSTAPDHPKNAGYSQGYVDWYRQILEYGAKFAFPTVFAHIRDKPDEPFVFHCTAGKDRTGVLSALILNLCDVDDHTIAWDYSLTVPGMGAWEETVEQEMVGDSMMPLRMHGGMTREEAHRVCGSRASNMARWLKVVLKGEFGGAASYLTKHCGFSSEDIEKIKANLIVAREGPVKPVDLHLKE